MKQRRSNLMEREGTRSVLASVISIVIGMLVGSLLILIMGLFNSELGLSSVWDGIRLVFGGIFSTGRSSSGALTWGFNPTSIGNMLFRATPLIMTGLSVAVAFKTGLFNIGAPGQYLMGTAASLIIALSIPTETVPAGLVWLLAFLGGALAASLSQTGKIGTVLAVQEPLQLRYQYGYMAGAKTVNPDCEVSVLFTNSYTDTNLGQESAKALYDKGADYVSCFAGACNLGVFNAAKEAGDGKYCLGAATGQFDKMPDKIVASVVKSIDVALYDMIKDYKDNGTFNGGGCTVLGLKEGGVELRYTTMNDELLNSIPEDVKASIEDLQNKIINGEITVPGTEEEYNTYIASLG